MELGKPSGAVTPSAKIRLGLDYLLSRRLTNDTSSVAATQTM